jgi:hypothetical protein
MQNDPPPLSPNYAGPVCVCVCVCQLLRASKNQNERSLAEPSPVAMPGCACLGIVSALNEPPERGSWYAQAAPRSADLSP